MNGRIIFLLEEPSMKVLLDGLLPRLFPGWMEDEHFLCLKHNGKSDLDKSIPVKLRAWKEPHVRFVVVRDNDSADCIAQKKRLSALCLNAGRPDTLVRLVCQELETWYLGDLQAVATAFGSEEGSVNINTSAFRKKFINPDSWQKPSIELARLIPSFQKISGARTMAQHLSEEKNRSTSFLFFLQGLRKIATEMGYQPVCMDPKNQK